MVWSSVLEKHPKKLQMVLEQSSQVSRRAVTVTVAMTTTSPWWSCNGCSYASKGCV